MLKKDIIVSFEINCDEIFCNNLIMLLQNYKTNKNNYELVNEISFNEDYDSLININQSNRKVNKNLFDIKIVYKNELVIGINKISYQYDYNGNSIKYMNNNKLSFYDIFSKKYPKFQDVYIIAENCNTFEVKNGIMYSLSNSDRNLKNTNQSTNINDYILREIYKTNNSMDNINIIMTNLGILAYTLVGLWFPQTNQTVKNNIIDKLKSMSIVSFSPNFYMDNTLCNAIKTKSTDTLINSNNILIDFNNSLNSTCEKNTIDEKLKINFLIENNNNESQKELNDKLVNFVDYVSLISKKHKVDNKINIYTINVVKTNLIEKIDNPEFATYSDAKKKLVEEKKSMEDIIKLIGIEPSKHISTEKINYEIEKKIVNTKYSSFENLYLRKQQDTILFDLTERFLNDKKIMEELGIPNKLGILLHGEPGCGKTTSIITIGSYLGRDIFYLNLKSVKTNHELKLIFDYVNTIHTGGGIIVLEDIDAMTNIVMDRTKIINSINSIDLINSSNKLNLNNLTETENDTVSLEYLLNLLDGTLTYNESVVIITTNHLNKLDSALYRPGRIDNLIEMKKCDHYQISRIFKRFIKRDIDTEILNKIPENEFTPAKIIFHLINWVKKRNESDETIMSEFIR